MFGVGGNKGCRERANGNDATILAAKVGDHTAHQAVGHAVAAVLRVGFDVGHNDDVANDFVIGDGHDVIAKHQFVPLSVGVVSDLGLHRTSVTGSSAPVSVLTA